MSDTPTPHHAAEPTTAGVGLNASGPDSPMETPYDRRDRERASARVQWRESRERKALVRNTLIIGSITLLIVGALTYGGVRFSSENPDDPAVVAYLIAAGVVIYGGAVVLWWNFRSLRGAYQDKVSLGLVSELQQEESDLAKRGTDFDSLWVITQKRIDLYHDIATEQAQGSFRSGQIAAYSGFAVIIVVAGIAAVTKSNTAAIAASVIGVAGAGLSGYIGATFMKTQAASAAQLRAYFLQPVEFARALAAERLVQTLPDEHRAKAVEQIVIAMMSTREPSA